MAAILNANPDPIIANIQIWLTNNDAHVQEGMRSPEGWEVWLQLELYFSFRANLTPGNTVAHERNNIWNQNAADRIDFWFTQPGGPIGIEVKCRTGNESSAVFVGRYLGDMTKCAQQLGVVPTTLYAVAVAC